MTRSYISKRKPEHTRFEITPYCAMALSLFYFLDNQGIFAAFAVNAFVHELGHYLTLSAMGAKPTLVRLEISGAVMYYDENRLNCGKEAIAAFSGPLAGLVFAFAVSRMSLIFPELYLVAGVGALLSAFNLLPAEKLDGGHIVYNIISIVSGPVKAEKVAGVLDAVTVVMLISFGLILMVKYSAGAALLAMGILLLVKENNIFLKCMGGKYKIKSEKSCLSKYKYDWR